MQASSERRRVLHRWPRLCIVPIHSAGYVWALAFIFALRNITLGGYLGGGEGGGGEERGGGGGQGFISGSFLRGEMSIAKFNRG